MEGLTFTIVNCTSVCNICLSSTIIGLRLSRFTLRLETLRCSPISQLCKAPQDAAQVRARVVCSHSEARQDCGSFGCRGSFSAWTWFPWYGYGARQIRNFDKIQSTTLPTTDGEASYGYQTMLQSYVKPSYTRLMLSMKYVLPNDNYYDML